MSCWKMVKFVKKIVHIIEGNYKRIMTHGSDIDNLTKRRRCICQSCNNKLRIFFIGDICKRCGCPIKSKTLVEDEQCPDGKW